MRLLIVTQAVDSSDLSLGFFHRWAELFAEKVESLEIICLKEGVHRLPQNVRVHSLGKEHARGSAWGRRVRYGLRFVRLIMVLRGRYDTVLVHMNEEYVLLGVLPWWLMGKRVGLWRNHVQGNWKAAIACRVVPVIFYTSPNTYATRFAHAHRMPTGIDVEQFAAARTDAPAGSLLSLGRIDPVKKVAELLAGLEALEDLRVPFHADLYGTPTPGREAYAESLEPQIKKLEEASILTRHPGVTHDKIAALYGSHRVFVNLTPPGSFDKTIFEAMAAGCLVVTTNTGLRDIIAPDLFVPSLEPRTVAAALGAALSRTDEAGRKECAGLEAYVRREHSLSALVEKVLAHLQ